VGYPAVLGWGVADPLQTCSPPHVSPSQIWSFTGSAVALHCGKAHVQSQWETANFDPDDIKITKKFQIVHIFISIHSAGASPQMDEILRFCDFFLVSYFVMLYFFSGTSQGRTRGCIFTVYGYPQKGRD